jgi:hypothetical protein
VQPAERVHTPGDEAAYVVLDGDVPDERDGAPARGGDGVDGGCGLVGGEGVDADGRAVGGEAQGDGAADARAGARDERRPSGEGAQGASGRRCRST